MPRSVYARLIVGVSIMAAFSVSFGVGKVAASTQVIFQENYEASWPGSWSVDDEVAASGYDYWGVTTYRSYEGSHSAWCAQVGTNSGNGQPNSYLHYYDTNMGSHMEIPLGDIGGYDSVTLSFYYWAITGSFSWGDNLEVLTWDGSIWTQIWTQPHLSSSGWQLASVGIPSAATWLNFFFVSDSTVGLGPYEGAYVDNVLVTASDSVTPTSSVSSLPAYTSASTLSVPCTASDSGSGVNYVELFYRLGSAGSFSKYATSGNPSGHWTSSPIDFDSVLTGGNGLYQFYTIATDNFGNVETAPVTPDASTTVDTVAPSTLHSLSGTVGSEGWFQSSVIVTLVAGDSTSGVGSTHYRIDSSTWQTYSTSFTYSAEGNHTLEYYSSDNAGNSETVKLTSLKVDTVSPLTSIEITGSLGRNSWYVDATVNVDLSATDSSSGVSSTAYRTNGGNWQSYSGEFQISQEGSFTIDFYSVDTAGNSESQKSTSFKIDTRVPSLTLDQSNGTLFKSNTVTVTWSCGDSISGLNRTEYSLDNSAYQACTGDSLTLTGVSDGTHTITLRGIDSAGNAVERTLSFKVDTNLFSLSGPMGPWLDVGLILVAVVTGALLLLLLGRRKTKPALAQSEEAEKVP